jgi:Zn-finger protein
LEKYSFFQHRECEYFPCHKGADVDSFNCLFCYCPLYALGDSCGGSFIYTSEGIKDCSRCLRPHLRENYGIIMEKMPQLLELAKKKSDAGEKP